MANIYEQLLYATLRIECLDENGKLFSIGTGFLFQRSVVEDKYKLYLLSNKYVLCGANSSQKKEIKLLGIVSATMIPNNQLKFIQTGTKLLAEEVLRLGIVYKATAIKELVDSMPTDNQ